MFLRHGHSEGTREPTACQELADPARPPKSGLRTGAGGPPQITAPDDAGLPFCGVSAVARCSSMAILSTRAVSARAYEDAGPSMAWRAYSGRAYAHLHNRRKAALQQLVRMAHVNLFAHR